VTTDVPLDRLPGVLRLVGSVDPAQTDTLSFGPEYFFGRRKLDEHPAPHAGRIRAAVRKVLLDRTARAEGATTAASAC
jgi:hypothetical protein